MVIAIALAIASVTAIVTIIVVAVTVVGVMSIIVFVTTNSPRLVQCLQGGEGKERCRIPRLTLSRGCVEAALGIIKNSPAPLQ